MRFGDNASPSMSLTAEQVSDWIRIGEIDDWPAIHCIDAVPQPHLRS